MLANYLTNSILIVLLVSLFSLARKLCSLFDANQVEVEFELLAKIVGLEVSYIEQEYSTESSTSKYIKIYDNVIEKVNLIGCSFDNSDIEKMIKATLNTFNAKGKMSNE